MATQRVQLGEHADPTHTGTPQTHLGVSRSHRMGGAGVRGGNTAAVVEVGGAAEQMKDKVKRLEGKSRGKRGAGDHGDGLTGPAGGKYLEEASLTGP